MEMQLLGKKQLILDLIDIGPPIFKQYKQNIINFTDDEIENLYAGEIDFKYSSINSDEKFFRLLLNHFNNFNYLLENWPEDSKREYLKDIWKEGKCLENLRNLTEEEIKKKIPIIENWPIEIQNEFFTIVHNYAQDTRIYLNKDYSDSDSESLIGSLNEEFNLIQELPNEIRRPLKKSYKNLLKHICLEISSLLMVDVTCLWKAYNTSLVKKEVKVANATKKEWIKNKVKSLMERIKNGKNETKFIEKMDWEKFANSNYAKGAYIFTTFVIFCSTAIRFYNTSKEIKKIDSYNTELNRIKRSFQEHLNEVEDQYIDITILKKVKLEIEKDLNDLTDLINKINDSIEYLKDQRIKAGLDILTSAAAVGAGIAGAVVTGGMSVVYGVCAALNTFSAGFTIADLLKANDGIKKLKKLLQDAEIKKKEMEDKLLIIEKRIKKEEKKIIEEIENKYWGRRLINY